MAHTGERAEAGTEDHRPGLLDRVPSDGNPPLLPSWSVPAALAALLFVGLAALYVSERLTPIPAVLIVGSALLLVGRWQPLRARPVVAGALLVNLALILIYFWSLDETHHVVVQVSANQISAKVDGDTTILKARPPGAGFGLEAAPLNSYRIQATGEAPQTDTGSLLGRVASAARLAEPLTAWTNIRITLPGSHPQDPGPLWAEAPTGSWSKNRRGELHGSPGSYMLFVPPAVRSYTISADLMRPDGTQELLVGLQGTRAGYALEVRLDQPDALWVSWANGDVVAGAGGTRLNHVAFMPAVQRAVRTVFTGYLFALFFAALALGLYPVLYGAFAATGETAQDDRGRLDAVLHDRRFRWGFFAAVSLAGLVFTALVATNLLQRIPHVQDDVAYLFQAKMFAAGAFNVPAPPIAIQSFFAEQFLPFFEGKWLSQYPPGHPLMLFLGVLVRAPWLVEPVLASLGLACVFLLGRRLYGTGVGVLAALLGLSSPFWLFLGSSFMSHATGMFFFVTFLLCYARAESEEGRVVWPLLAGFLAGMMFITRELTAVGLLAPIAIYTLICFRRWRWALLPALAGVAVPLGLMAVYNWVQMGNPLRSTYFAWDPHFALGFGSHVGPLGPFTPGDGVWNVYQNLSMLSAQLYGWPYGVALALAFLPFALCAARRWDFLLAACFIGVASAHAFYWAPGLMYGPRYYYEALPALFLLTARGAFELGRLPLRIWPSMGLPRDVTLAAFFPAVLLAVLLVFNLRFYLPQQIPLYRGYNFSSNSELQAVQNANIHHAIVFVESPEGRWTDYGNVFFANDPHLDGDIIYARDEGPNDSLLYKYFPGRAHYRLLGTSLTRLSP